MAQREVCKDTRHQEPTFVCALWSRRFPRCPVRSDLPSTKPLTTHLLNRVLRILSTGPGEKKNPPLAPVPSTKRVTSPRAKGNPNSTRSDVDRTKDAVRPHQACLRPSGHTPDAPALCHVWTWLIWVSLALETLRPQLSVPLERKAGGERQPDGDGDRQLFGATAPLLTHLLKKETKP